MIHDAQKEREEREATEQKLLDVLEQTLSAVEKAVKDDDDQDEEDWVFY